MYDVQDWAEVHRLHRDGWTNTAIAEKFGMSRNPVSSLIAKQMPPRCYGPALAGSMLDDYAVAIAAMLDEDPRAPDPPAAPGQPRPARPHQLRASPRSVEASPMRRGDARDTTEVRPRVP